MKAINLAVVLLVLCSGCLKNKNLLFCEGTSPEGKGINCGTKFTTGDFNAVVDAENAFSAKMLHFVLYETESNKSIDSYSVQVKPEDKNAQATITVENAGKYKVVVTANKVVIAEANIEIIDM